jgi:dihydrofolate reductase
MRILRVLMHLSLDGFCAGPKGEMNWITLNDAIFADVHGMIDTTGAAVYGRTTYGMMRGYWPTVLNQQDADPEQRKHAQWVERIPKHTFSRTLKSHDWNNVHLHGDAGDIETLKQGAGAPLLIFGSPSLTHAFMALDAVDEYWLYLNPILLGEGMPLFRRQHRTALTLIDSKGLPGGVVRLHYSKERTVS